MPKKLALAGKYSKDFFNVKGELRNIRDLRFWPLTSVLESKYELPGAEAEPFAQFLTPMLNFNPPRCALRARSTQTAHASYSRMRACSRVPARILTRAHAHPHACPRAILTRARAHARVCSRFAGVRPRGRC